MSARTILKHLHQQGRMTDYQFDVINRNLKVRPQGHWVDDNGADSYYANCSCCGYQIDTHYERGYLNFCPNCGADMSQHDSNLCDRAIADLSKCIDDMYDKLKEENRADMRGGRE